MDAAEESNPNGSRAGEVWTLNNRQTIRKGNSMCNNNGLQLCLCGRDYVDVMDQICWICLAERERGELCVADQMVIAHEEEQQRIEDEERAAWDEYDNQQQQQAENERARTAGQSSAQRERIEQPTYKFTGNRRNG